VNLRLHPPRLDALDELQGECLVLTFFADDRPLRGLTGLVDWRLNGSLSRLLLREFLDGHFGESLLVPVAGRLPFPRAVVIGMGRRTEFTTARFEDVCRVAFGALHGLGVARFAMALPGRVGLDVGLRQALQGWRRALIESFPPEVLSRLDVMVLETPEVQRELVEPMRALSRELSGLAETG
jgi:hypothetical protein